MRKSFLLLGLTLSFQIFGQTAPQDLEKLFRANPGLMTQSNPRILRDQAKKILGQESAKRIFDFMNGNLADVTLTRMKVIEFVKLNPGKNLRRVVVSGQSVTGLMTAAIAAQSGHKVDVYDTRMSYTRGIQWSSRQSVPDSLAAIDPKLAQDYAKEVAQDLILGSSSIKPDGKISPGLPPSFIDQPDPRRIPINPFDMLDEPVVSNVQTRKFETLLYDFLKNHPNVTQHKGKIEIGPKDPKTGEHIIREFDDVTPDGQKEKVFKEVTKRGSNPIVIVAEGAGSSTRASLGIQSINASEARLQTAGVVHLEKGGTIVTHWRAENPGTLITGSIAVKDSNERWFATDIDEGKVTPGKNFGSDPKAPAYVQERARLLELEFKRIAEMNMQMSPGSLKNVKVTGAIGSLPLQTFELQQHISSRAISGSNVLLAGDAVGNGHWRVGGGMHVGVVAHPERFRQFLTAVNGGMPLKSAVLAYEAEALSDTYAWVRSGIHNFYDNMSPAVARAAFDEAHKLLREGKVDSYQRALQLQFPEGRKATAAKKIRLNCSEIPLRVLGEL